MIDPRKTVGEIATEQPRATHVFERYGIDYSCAGARTLVGVCSERDIPVDRLVQEIESASSPSLRMTPKFDDMAELLDHIVSTHHTFARAELAKLVPLTEKVRREHGHRFGDLDRIRHLVSELAADLGPHMEKEERVLFPYCVALEEASSAGAAKPRSVFGSVARPIAAMRHEHVTMTRILSELHMLSCVVPEGAPEPVRALYNRLCVLERDLHEHIHLENNVLFPAVERLESGLAA